MKVHCVDPPVCLQPSDADVVARPAEDGRGEQEGPDGLELHQVTQQSGRPADCVSVSLSFDSGKNHLTSDDRIRCRSLEVITFRKSASFPQARADGG